MIFLPTLLRRTAATLGAIAALTATGLATAQTVTLSGTTTNSCAYQTMTVSPSGSVQVTCTTTNSAGTFRLVAPSSLPTSFTTTTEVSVARSSGTTGSIDVAFSVLGSGCSPVTSSPLTFADTVGGSQPIVLNTSPTDGASCTVSITPAPPGVSGSPTSKTISIVNPDSNVTFAYSGANPIPASVGSGPILITVNRAGGTANQWTVPYTFPYASSMGTVSGTLNFPANSSAASVSYSPPATAPASLPATLNITLGTPTTTAVTAQTGTITGSNIIPINLTGPAAGCPVPETALRDAASDGFVTHLRMPGGDIATWALPPVNRGAASGIFGLYETAFSTPPVGFSIEIHINKCKGLIQPTTDACYLSTTNSKGGERKWITRLIPGTKFDTVAHVVTAGYCYTPSTDGPYYINVRYNFPTGCTALATLGGGNCGWDAVWKTYTP
jgi:hypothetical protein